MKHLEVEDIREALFDRSPTDNDLTLALAYTDEDILKAMEAFSNRVAGYSPPGPIFGPLDIPMMGWTQDGIIVELYKKKRNQLIRNQVEYQSKGMKLDTITPHLNGLNALIRELEPTVRHDAEVYKRSLSFNSGFGVQIG